ncbi:hypothetical protein FHU33_3936, partial [Blastococcus colisei]
MSRLLLLVVITLVLGAMAWLIQGLESR